MLRLGLGMSDVEDKAVRACHLRLVDDEDEGGVGGRRVVDESVGSFHRKQRENK
jgi:hypothetical protein